MSDREKAELLKRLVGEVSWERIFQKLGLSARRRTSGVLVLRCVFHREASPSLHCWPSGNFKCHGCGLQGNFVDFVSGLEFKDVCGADDLIDFFITLPSPPDPNQLPLPFINAKPAF
ncbi:MAG: hypothetical protein HYT03_00190 [Candidatus Harrisonbacteria bacterium]|nr:hypothetical protein [Candidatus Harrisonbacteria bacterium]